MSSPALTTLDNKVFHRFTTAQFLQETEITGHIVAHVNVSVTPNLGGSEPKDIDVFLTIRNWEVKGNEKFYTGTIGGLIPVTKGWQSVSLRKVTKDHPRHREYRPYRDYFSTDVQPVMPGEIYAVGNIE